MEENSKNKESKLSKYKNVIILASVSFILLLIVCMIVMFSKKTMFNVSMRVRTNGGSITSERGLATSAIENGKDLKIYISPDEGYEIEKVLVDNKAIDLKTLVYDKNNPNAASEDGVAVYTLKNINKDYTVDVYYKAKSNTEKTTFNVSMRVRTNGGSITSERGLATSAIEKGKDLKIYISPDEGYEIEKLLVDNKAIDLKTLVYDKNNPNAASEDGVAVYTFKNINKNHTVEVYYKTK